MRLSGGHDARYTPALNGFVRLAKTARVSVTMPGCAIGRMSEGNSFDVRMCERTKRHTGAQISDTCLIATSERVYCGGGTNRFSRVCRVKLTQFVRAGYVPAGLFHLSVVPADRINGAAAADQSG